MKKLLLIMLLTLFGASVYAQNIVTESFESTTAGSTTPPTGWQNVTISGTTELWSFESSGLYPTCSPYDGSRMAKYACYDYDSDQRSALISPVVNLSGNTGSNAYIKFWMYRDDAYPTYDDSLIVYVNTSASMTGATRLGYVCRNYLEYPSESAANAWYQYTFTIPSSFTSTSNYFIIEGMSKYGNNIYFDKIEYTNFVSPMTFTSSNTIQVTTAPVRVGTTNQPILAMQVVTAGESSPLSTTNLNFTIPGTVNTANITNAKIYYTGSSATFATTNLLGTVANPSGTFSVPITQTLASGNNYFWLTYDISGTATTNQVVDAICNNLTIAAVNRIPTTTDPVGSRTIKNALAGTYTLGPSGNYTTLADAMDDVSFLGMTAPVTFSVTGNITDTRQASLYAPDLGANLGVTIKPATGVNATINAGHGGQVLFVGGFNNLTIDGSNTLNGTTRNLTFNNTSTAAVAHGIFLQSVSNVALKNLTVTNASTGTAVGVVFSTSSNSSLTNSKVCKNNVALVIQNHCSNLTVNKNLFGSDLAAEAMKTMAVQCIVGSGYTYSVDGFTFADNDVNGIYNADASSVSRGLYLQSALNSSIVRNKIHNLDNTGGQIYAVQLMGIVGQSPAQSLNMTFANNMIYDITGSSNALAFVINDAANLNIYHNTLNMASTVTGSFGVGFYWWQNLSNIKFVNNIVNNESSASTKYVMYSPLTANPFTEIAGNIYNISSGASFSYYNGTTQAAFNDWKTALGGGANESNSFAKTVSFVSATDLHVSGSSIGDVDLFKSTVTGITSDFDNESRPASINYAGADAVVPNLAVVSDLSKSYILCNGSNFSATVNANVVNYGDGISRTTTNPIVYTWYKDEFEIINEDGIPGLTVAGNTVNINNATSDHTGTYWCTMNFGGVSTSSTMAGIDVQYPIVLESTVQDVGACWGGAPFVQLWINASGTIQNYQWQKEVNGEEGTYFQDLAEETNSVLTIPLTGDPQQVAGRYRVLVFGPGNCGPATVTSNIATVSITEPISNEHYEYEFNESNICEDATITITAQANGTITGYQWEKYVNGIWTPIALNDNPTAQSQTFEMVAVKPDMSGEYRVRIFGSPQCAVSDVPLEPINMLIWPQFKVAYQPKDQTLCENESINLSVIGEGEINGYQWYYEGKPIDATTNPTATTAFLEIKNASYLLSGSYACELTVSDCRGLNRKEMSAPAEVYVLRATQITKQPAALTMAQIGERIELAVEAHHKGKTPPFYKDKFQWYRYNASTLTSVELADNSKFAGTKSSILSINKIEASDFTTNGDYYYVVVEGICGNATSAPALINEGLRLTVKTQANGFATCESNPAKLTFEVEVNNPQYQVEYKWFKDGVEIPNSNMSEFNFTAIMAAEAGKYHAQAMVANMPSVMIESDKVDVVVNVGPTITTQLPAKLDVVVSKDIELTVVATGSGTFTYEWYKDNTLITGAIGPKYTKTNADANDAGKYAVKVLNDCGEELSSETVVTVTKTGIVGVVENDNEYGLTINPNPVSNAAEISFKTTSASNAKVKLMDINGREVAVLYNAVANDLVKINLNSSQLNLANGTYLIVLEVNGNVTSKQVVINR